MRWTACPRAQSAPPVTRRALTADAPAALLMMVGLRPFVPMRRLPCSRRAPSKVVGKCRGGYSSTKSGSARPCCHAWAMDSSPTPAGFATVVACLRMPAEDYFSSDEERDDSNELPDLMAQLAPLLREDIRTTNESASQRRPTTRLGQRSGRGAQRRGNDPGSPGTTHSCSRRFSESRPTVW